MNVAYDICITGATGFVGSHLLYDLLRQTELQLLALLRGEETSARRRLWKTLNDVAASRGGSPLTSAQLARLSVVSGDVTREQCGVDDTWCAELRDRVGQFWHLAASLKFEDKHRAEIYEMNVSGTNHALALAAHWNVARFVYMSTAYVCGTREGAIPEQLFDSNTVFHNEYERSKCAAEHMVIDRCQAVGMDARIVRPSIVVGPRQTYAPGGSQTGLYGFIREIHGVHNTLRAMQTSLVLEGTASAPLNFVPVDEVSSALIALERDGFADGPIYHLTSDSCPDVATTMATIARQCAVCPIEVIDQRCRPATPVERLFDARARFYRPYMSGQRRFLRARGGRVEVSGRELNHYVAEYVRRCRSTTAAQVFSSAVVESSDGAQLTTFARGNPTHSAMLIVNAFGMPMDFWVPLAKALGSRHYIVGWNLRGTDAGPLDGDLEVEAQLSDLARVMDHYGIQRACLVGWCTGADLALEFACRRPERVTGTVFVNGAFCRTGGSLTPFQTDLQHVLAAAGQDIERARVYHELIYQTPAAAVVNVDVDGEQDTLASILHTIDPDAMDLASLPFRSAEHLYRYARAMTEYHRWCERTAFTAQLRSQALVISSERDHVIDPATSRRIAKHLRAALYVVKEGTHFAHFDRRDVIEAIGNFAAKQWQASQFDPAHTAVAGAQNRMATLVSRCGGQRPQRLLL